MYKLLCKLHGVVTVLEQQSIVWQLLIDTWRRIAPPSILSNSPCKVAKILVGFSIDAGLTVLGVHYSQAAAVYHVCR